MKLSLPIFRLKRQARQQARETGIPLNRALDAIARAEGFQSWSQLAAAWADRSPAARLLAQLVPGDLLLLGARPRQGKTMLGFELLAEAAGEGRPGYFFTLEYSERDVADRMAAIGVDKHSDGALLRLDTSDHISAAHVIAAMEEAPEGAVAVIDYLQLLDQRRENPELEDQVRALRTFAGDRGLVIVLISQIDRRYEASGKVMPDLSDVRLPNPLDLTLFAKSCFLQDGEIRIAAVD